MKRTSPIFRPSLSAALLLLPVAAHAHHAEAMSGMPFLQGASMPVHGVDHLLSALAVGLIASRATGSMRYKLPALFALIALLGGFLNLGGVTLPELAVPLCVAAAGVLLWRRTPTVTAGIFLAALAGLANGQALLEVPPTTLSSAVFAAGCLLSALGVCALGFSLGRSVFQQPRAGRFAGAALLASAALVALFPALNAALIRCIE